MTARTETAQCERCDRPSKHGTLCGSCLADDYDDFDQGDDRCYECGGEGFVSDCFEEWACVDPESGCDLCTRRCDVCMPHTPTTQDTRAALGELIASTADQYGDIEP
jgi:hypothetical protein